MQAKPDDVAVRISELLDEIVETEMLDERLKKEMLIDDDARKAVFFMSYERE